MHSGFCGIFDICFFLPCQKRSKLSKLKVCSTFVTTRSFKNYSPDRFLKDITSAPWSLLETFDDPDDKLHAFNLLFNNILEEHAPVKAIRLQGRPNPSITDDIPKLMATRDKWKRDFKQTKDPLAWSIYKNLSRELKREIHLVEKGFIWVVKRYVFSSMIRFSPLFSDP